MVIEQPALYPHQIDMVDRLRKSIAKHRAVILQAPPGTGKCLGLGTPVMMSNGKIKPVEEVMDGDELMGPDGKPRRVLSTTSGVDSLFEIRPTKGDPFVCNAAHILCLRFSGAKEKTINGYSTNEEAEISVVEYLKCSSNLKHRAKLFRASAIEFPEREEGMFGKEELPLAPYFVGLWLGDGSHRDPEVTTEDVEIEAYLRGFSEATRRQLVFRGNTGNARTWAITDGGGLRNKLRRFVTDGRKFIPHAYKTASRRERLELLAGLIDSDGSNAGNCYDFTQKSKRLADDVAFVCRSLGLSCYPKAVRKTCTNNGKVNTYWRMTISGPSLVEVPVLLERKKCEVRKQKKDVLNTGFTVHSLGKGEYYGFEIDGDGRFLLGDFTVTHNTRIAKWMLGSAANRKPKPNQTGKSLFAVHRRGLVDNASNSFNEAPALPHGVLMSGVEHNATRPVQVASIDTLLSWFCEGGKYGWDETFDLICFDESHSHHSKLQTFLTAHNQRRLDEGLGLPYVIGLTATPQAQGLADIYQEIVRGPETQWLIDQGFLSPYRYFRATQGKLGLLVKKGDEYTKDSVCSAMDGLSGDLVRDWKKFAEGRATVGFFPRRTHAKEAQEALCKAGIKAEYVDGETDDDRRQSLYKWLNNGTIDYLCNVGVVERGTDIPRVGCVQMCTAVGNVVRWLQMIGRGSRVHPDVPDCLVLDHGGGIAKHGFFEDSIPWTLDWSERPSKEHVARPKIECPRCQAVYRGGKCRSCGYEPSTGERKSQGLEFDGAELKEVKRKEKSESKPQSCEQIMVSALYACGKSGRTWKQALAIAYSKARSQGMRFKVPKKFEVGGRVYKPVPYGSTDSSRRVRDLYDFV